MFFKFFFEMKKEYRVKKNQEIIDLLKLKQTVGDRYFVIYKSKIKESHFRYAVSVNKKYGNAPERNKAKRRVREVVKLYQYKNLDFFIVIKTTVKELSFNDIHNKLLKLFKRAEILEGGTTIEQKD